MLRFFRNMRQVLVPEHRLARFFLYSVGEIVLVVVGIVFALAIDNWNEDRNRLEDAQKHLITLSQNVEEDMVQIRDLNAMMDTIERYSDVLFDQLKTLTPVDNNTQLYLTYLGFEMSLNPNRSGLEMINNDGLMAYLDEDVQAMILTYYTLLDHIHSREEITNSFIKDKYEVFLIEEYNVIFNKTNPLPLLADFYSDDPRIPEPLNEEKLLSDKSLETLVFARTYQSRRQKELYEETLELANQLINRIKAQLNPKQ